MILSRVSGGRQLEVGRIPALALEVHGGRRVDYVVRNGTPEGGLEKPSKTTPAIIPAAGHDRGDREIYLNLNCYQSPASGDPDGPC